MFRQQARGEDEICVQILGKGGWRDYVSRSVQIPGKGGGMDNVYVFRYRGGADKEGICPNTEEGDKKG